MVYIKNVFGIRSLKGKRKVLVIKWSRYSYLRVKK